jgi:hypothetical protein
MAITWRKIAYELDVIKKSDFTAHGDLLYGTGAGTFDALHHGNAGDVLTLAADVPTWAAPAAPAAHHLNDHTAADGAVDFNLQVATDFVVHTVANEAALPAGAGTVAVGQLCWATGELSLHVCTVAA